jgi:hypothetical protein
MRRSTSSGFVVLASIAVAASLTACQDFSSAVSEDSADAAAEMVDVRAAALADMAASASGADAQSDRAPPIDGSAPANTIPQLAYSYDYVIALPTRSVRPLAASHEQACVQAGPQRCQLIGSSNEEMGEDDQIVRLELRATPEWLAAFRNGLAAEAEAADGEVVRSSTQSEDLTRAIIDTEAHLRAKTTLRDRLQAMLATRDGNLQTVLEVERELARVQAEIDSATSTLQAMRARVSMSNLTMTYQSRGVLAPDTATAPLESALTGALGLFMMGLAAIVSVLAFSLPFLLVMGPIVWLIMLALRRRKARRSAAQAVRQGPVDVGE